LKKGSSKSLSTANKKSANNGKSNKKSVGKASKTTKATKSTKQATKQQTTKQQIAKQQLVDKYVAEAKGEAKAAAIQVTAAPKPTYECSHGECCDIKTGRFKTAGVTCYRTPCSGPSQCLGVSSQCPPSTSFIADGTACPDGYCSSGVCVKGAPPKNTTASKPNVDIVTDDGKNANWYVVDHKIKCTQGGCCNLETGFVKVLGSTCTASKHECYESVSTCNGYESKCPRKAVADGTACTGGTCHNGVCISTAPVSAPESGKLSELNQKQADAMDIAIAELDAKISKARRRQQVLEKAMKHHKIENNRRFLRSALDMTHKKIKSEYELARRAVYPFQTTTTEEQLFDTGAHDYTVHDYVKQLAKEQQDYNKKLYSNAASILQSSATSKSDGFSFALVGGFTLFVIALVLIVFFVKTARGKSKKSKDEDYDNF